MTTTTNFAHTRALGDSRPALTPPVVPFARVVAVETRKFFDTRLALILIGALLVGSIVSMTGYAAALGAGLQDTITFSGLALSILLPVLGIMSVTSEFSQRTALTTFVLEPRRWRVLLAKGIPPVVATATMGVIVIAAAFAIVALVEAVQGTSPSFDLDPVRLAGWAATCLILVLNGVAMGTFLLNAPAAIIICVGGGLYWGLIGLAGDVGATAAHWLDLNHATAFLLHGTTTAEAIGPLVVSVLVWIVIPFVLGVVRVNRKEIR